MIGQTLGHYKILDKLGEGGMGEVYLARDSTLDREVALKVLPEIYSTDPDRLARFEREAKALATLNHPNIVTIYSIESSVGQLPAAGPQLPAGSRELEADSREGGRVVHFLTMEFVQGEPLSELIPEGGMAHDRFLDLAIPLTDALAAAHGRGIIHRDLKPSNIMVTSEGRVKILDFGLAKLFAPAISDVGAPLAGTQVRTELLTEEGLVIGTLPYMSPEQVEGEELDARSDIFSLGCVLYEMLAGRRPFEGDTDASRLVAVLRDDPLPLTGVPPNVAQLVERCLRKNVAERFQSAAELKSAIETGPTSRADRQQHSVAVLPFANMSGAKEDDYLCEGLAEEIINVLTLIPGLRVISRTSSFVVGRMELDVREAGARLDVGSILEGSVRRAGQRVRVTAQLVNTSDGGHLWSERFDRELTDVLALEDEIAEAIAERLRVDLGRDDRVEQRRGVDVEAHTAFLEGRYYFARGTPEALAQAKACLERAIKRDPNFALAFDSLAELYWYLGLFGNIPPREAFSQSTWYALRALELDDTLAETHALLGMLRKELDYNWPEVERENARARELNRESPLVRLRYAISGLLPHGRIDEAMVEVEATLQSDPLSLFVRWWVAVMAFLGRRWERVLDEGRHMIALDPSHFLGHWAVGMAHIGTGEPDEGVTAFEKAHELSGGIPLTLGYLAYAYGCAGRRDDTGKMLEQAEAIAENTYLPPSTFALGHVGLEDWDAAFHWWNQAIEVRDPFIMPIKSYPFFDPVRGDPRFRAMLQRMNLAE